MPRFSVTGPLGPEAIDYGHVTAESPLEALHRIHVDGLGPAAVRLVGNQFVFADPADQELCAGSWAVVEFRRGGNVTHALEIAPPVPVAA